MAKAIGRRPEESSDPQSERHGAESWALILAVLVAVAIMGALMAFAH